MMMIFLVNLLGGLFSW